MCTGRSLARNLITLDSRRAETNCGVFLLSEEFDEDFYLWGFLAYDLSLRPQTVVVSLVDSSAALRGDGF